MHRAAAQSSNDVSHQDLIGGSSRLLRADAVRRLPSADRGRLLNPRSITRSRILPSRHLLVSMLDIDIVEHNDRCGPSEESLDRGLLLERSSSHNAGPWSMGFNAKDSVMRSHETRADFGMTSHGLQTEEITVASMEMPVVGAMRYSSDPHGLLDTIETTSAPPRKKLPCESSGEFVSILSFGFGALADERSGATAAPFSPLKNVRNANYLDPSERGWTGAEVDDNARQPTAVVTPPLKELREGSAAELQERLCEKVTLERLWSPDSSNSVVTERKALDPTEP